MVHHEFASSLAATMRAIRDWDLGWFTVTGNSILPNARAQCLAQARAWNADKFIFIDDDVSWKVQDFIFLVAHRVKICTGFYALRPNDGGGPTKISIKFLPGQSLETMTDGLMEIEGSGFGFFRFDREVIERMEPDCKPLHDPHLPDEINQNFSDFFPYGYEWKEQHKAYSLAGEDIHFCHRAKALGYPTFLDPAISLGHHQGANCYRADILSKER